VLSSVLMYISVRMVDLRALVLLLSSLQMMLATQFSNSTVMIGKAAHSKFVKTVTPEHLVALVAVVGSEHVVVLAEDLVHVVALEHAVDLVEDLEVHAEASVAVFKDHLMVVSMLLSHLLHQIHSLISLLLGPKEARPYMFAIFLGRLATRILWNCSPRLARSSKLKFSMSRMDAPVVPVW